MIYEYAVDPACLGNWQTFRYLLTQFGVSQGRVISRFPKNWKKDVHQLVKSSDSFRNKEMLIENALNIIPRVLVRSGRPYDDAKDWLDNALLQQETNPFYAIIAKEARVKKNNLLVADEIGQGTPHWAIPRERKVLRTTDALGEAVAPLLRISHKILFVDKLFHPAFDRWRESLERFIKIAGEGKDRIPQFEYHCGIDNKGSETEVFHDSCRRYLPQILPKGASIQINCWGPKRSGGDFFHARYILADKGGMRIDWGLDHANGTSKTTDVSLLDENIWEEEWNRLTSTPSYYDKLDSFIIKND